MLVGFVATPMDRGVRLTWQTASESSNLGFRLWRRKASGNFEALTFVPGTGDSIGIRDYAFVDGTAGRGFYTYRLQQVNHDGEGAMLDVQAVILSSVISLSWREHKADLGINCESLGLICK
jgi:hypothetical protein